MYKKYFKRLLDIVISLCAIIILMPVYVIVSILVLIFMGWPIVFKQARPGKDEKIFNMYKFRTMTNKKDKDGNLLPDSQRLTKFGKFLRKTSIDELPELFLIFFGRMSIVGPRPLVPQYLPYYTKEEHRRHDVRPGLTGWAQVNGRNNLNWDERFKLDVFYVENITLLMDLKIVFLTIWKVLKSSDISVRGTGKTVDFDEYRKKSIVNDEIDLREIKKEDYKILMEMNNDPKIAKYVVGNPKKVTEKEQLTWMEKIKTENNTKRYIITKNKIGIGTIIISDINFENKIANINIKLLSSESGKGIGKKAILLSLEKCFNELNVECVTAHILSYNERSIKTFEKCGFTREGTLRNRVIKNNIKYDLFSYSILKEEYMEQKVK